MLKKFIKADEYYAIGDYPGARFDDYSSNRKAYVLTTKGSFINEKYNGTYESVSLIGGSYILVAIQAKDGWWGWRKVTPSHFVMPWDEFEPKLIEYHAQQKADMDAAKAREQARIAKYQKLKRLLKERAGGYEPRHFHEYNSHVEVSVDQLIAILENTLPMIG
jgi:hypothetical protein